MTPEPSPFDSAAEFALFARGDEAALERLIAAHLPGLRAFVRVRLGPALRAKESGSDVVQSVCREVLEHMDRFQHPGEGAFRAWLYTTAMRKISNRAEYFTAAKRDVAREVHDSQVLGAYQAMPTPSQFAMGREALERIESSLDALSEDQREVVLLTRIVGLSRAEVAERMERTEASVRSLLTRALAELSDRLVDPE